ncbi:MAG: GntR family transcriptional regulator [Mogibacterium sp.]|nr:GntR family transcriptional regulator [Mogibacterium sp.]
MFQLDIKSNKSVYEQVIDRIKELVMMGVLTEGSKLPSVRELSRQLTINPNTVQKAFKELERDGYIYTVSGKGTFVSGRELITLDNAKVSDTLDRLRESFRALTYLGVDPNDAKDKAFEAIESELEKIKSTRQTKESDSGMEGKRGANDNR